MCKYCDRGNPKCIDIEESDGGFTICHTVLSGVGELETIMMYRHDLFDDGMFPNVKINYCPMCGRKLAADAES